MHNYDKWIEFFTSDDADDIHVYPQFTVGGIDRKYGVVVEYRQSGNDILLLYISTRPGWPNTPQGAKGYIYSVDGQKPGGFWEQEYDIVQLDGNVFCYEK